MNLSLSVIICAHNPRRPNLEKVLLALQAQTLPLERWELLLIDNASTPPLASEIDLSWHPHARHIREAALGLTPARLCGIRSAQAELLVFVDDDNVLDPDYLATAVSIDQKWPQLGVWGGQVRPAFEIEPPDWTRIYWGNLAIREFDDDRWSNLPNHGEALPCGAGLCIRQPIAAKYAELVQSDPKRTGLDRKGNLLTSGGDTDMALTACDLGMGMGQFTALKLTHLIPAQRLQEEYLLRLEEGMSYSGIMLRFLRGEDLSVSWRRKVFLFSRQLFMNPRARRFYGAAQRGVRLAIADIANQRQLST